MRKTAGLAIAAWAVFAGVAAMAQTMPTTSATQSTSEMSPTAAANAAAGTSWSIGVGAFYEPSANLDNPGPADASFAMERYGATIAVSYPISGTAWRFDHALTYEYDQYNFSGTMQFEHDGKTVSSSVPWDNTQLLSYTLSIGYAIDRNWLIFGGPIIGAVGETGADFGDSLTYGGLAGVRYQASKDFAIGLGAIVTFGLEEDGLVLPLVLIDWQITDNLALRNARKQPGVRGTAGVELGWTFAPKWTLAAGGAYDVRRFRLNDDAIAPDGIAQNSGWPVYIRLGFDPSKNWSFSLLGGYVFGGQLLLEDQNGNKLGTTDYAASPYMGLAASYRF